MTVPEDRCDEERCANLIAQARKIGALGGCVIAPPDQFSKREVDVADATIQRERDNVRVLRGTITMSPPDASPRVRRTVTSAMVMRLPS